MKRTSQKLDARRQAFSLLEVTLGLTVIALILVPTTEMVTDALRGETRLSSRKELIHLAESKQAEFAYAARVQMRDRTATGNFRGVGFPNARFRVVTSQAASAGGIPGRLQTIATTVWDDANRNRRQDADEVAIELWTAISRTQL